MEPCVEVKSECTQWVALGGGPARAMLYSTYSLEERNPAITRALIVVHGQRRNADGYFRTAVAAASMANALADTLLIAPRFAASNRSCKDALAADEVNWTCSGVSWRAGGIAVGNETLTSFDLADELLRKLARKDLFPNLAHIVVAGHSAGGQFVTRYEAANQVHEKLGVTVSYVVASPSSYAWPDSSRPVPDESCDGYDRWPYGWQRRTGYSARVTDEQMSRQLASRPVTYMVGALDTLPNSHFDSSCRAMAQGPNRFARAQAFTAYLKDQYKVQLTFMTIPACGHSARCMFTADRALPALFPR